MNPDCTQCEIIKQMREMLKIAKQTIQSQKEAIERLRKEKEPPKVMLLMN